MYMFVFVDERRIMEHEIRPHFSNWTLGPKEESIIMDKDSED